MKYISILVLYQGISYLISGIDNLMNETMMKFGITYIDSQFNTIGVILGLALIIIGIGIFKKKVKAYYAAMNFYIVLFFYGLISTIYIGLLNGFTIGFLLSSITVLLICFFLAKYILKEIQNYLESNNN